MRIGKSKMLGAAAVAAALSMGGTARADPGAERTSMCELCGTLRERQCYNYKVIPPAAAETKTGTTEATPERKADAGVGMEPKGGACTYPPCYGLGFDAKLIKQHTEEKLICATCRAMCDNTPGGPGAEPNATPPGKGTKGERKATKRTAKTPPASPTK